MTIVTQFSKTDPMLSHEPWEAIVARHYMLLCEYYDFLSTTQDYSASPKLRELASKLAMPARLWEKGIRSLLDRLHGCLPESHDHMCTFIDLACFIMARVYRTVPAFESTWIEHLGDLGAYRIAMKDDHLQDREAWTSATRQWYSEASHRYPSIGRLYHRLAVCAKPNTLEQLFFYTKSLCVRVPFLDARDSLATFFEQNMNGGVIAAMDINTAFVRAHGLLFSGKDYDQFIAQSKILTEHLATSACQWTEDGYHISIVLSCALLEYGSESNPIMRIIKQGHADEGGLAMSHTPKADEMMPYPNQRFTHALGFVSRAHRAVFSSTGEEKTSSYLHVALVFLHHVSQFSKAMALVGDKMPWKGICSYLNMMMESCSSVQKMESDDLPHSVSQAVQPLPEDFALRGLLWAEKYYPDEWFSRIGADTDETDPPTGWMLQERADRCLWLGCRIAKSGVWLQYDKTVGRFRADSMFESEL
ncbi:hypothetical protein CABS02_13201 [Colletotrichum abscissum]|uniref:DNA/RNA-binding domain-containing protein n=1 Tax=Colletotrichum abscissum TaxID=1671311 RepID=A0A9Q0AX79_9PEZI|nr:hypothetical protein CABS02_13201 [Colletotrichum abscissum]